MKQKSSLNKKIDDFIPLTPTYARMMSHDTWEQKHSTCLQVSDQPDLILGPVSRFGRLFSVPGYSCMGIVI